MLRDIGHLPTEFSSDTNDIGREFYAPCLANSTSYDRITGFFSSTVFHLLHHSLGEFFVANGGRMRLLCSPRLSSPDADGLLYGYAARDNATLAGELRKELDEMLATNFADSVRLLAVLVATARLDVRLARVGEVAASTDKRMFHDKVGVFRDAVGDTVGFRGSLNESFLGLAPTGNIESIDVWPSWEGGRDAVRSQNAVARFERLWKGDVAGVSVAALPEEIKAELERVAEDVDLEALLDELAHRTAPTNTIAPTTVGGIPLRRHQEDAIQKWIDNGHRGVLAHATGSGKTITGLNCAAEAIRADMVPVILVPSTLLLEQWADQVRELLGARVVMVGGGNNSWNRGGQLRAAVEAAKSGRPYVVIAVLNSAIQPSFRSQLRPVASRCLVIVDEVHRIGSPQFRTILEWFDAAWRLGLSATPERANDDVGTGALLNYFDGVIDRYTLKDALDAGVLAPYVYHPSWVGLSEEEQQRWDDLTTEIRQRYAIAKAPGASSHAEEHLQRKLIERARIAKNAMGKVPHAVRIVQQRYAVDRQQRWLIYCDNQSQLRDVRDGLQQVGIASWEYHRQMAGDPEATLRLFEMNGGIVVAIKCLDEGVDIPSATHALILASSRNPREFIQRRGRVLRRAPRKTVATLMDVLVLPGSLDQSDPSWSLALGELARAMQFAEWGLGEAALSQLEDKWVSMGLPLSELDAVAPAGVETDSGGRDDDD